MSKKRRKRSLARSVNKGKVSERAACHYLTSMGFPARREARNGVSGAHDIKCDCLNIHLEVKNRKRIDLGTKELDRAMEQAWQAANGKLPAVLWKTNHRPWRLTFYSEQRVMVTCCGDDTIRRMLQWLSTQQR